MKLLQSLDLLLFFIVDGYTPPYLRQLEKESPWRMFIVGLLF